jgi:hypothetical protein
MPKKVGLFFLCFIISALNVTSSPLSLKLYGGRSWFGGGDLASSIQGWLSYLRDRNSSPYSTSADLKELRGFWDAGAELTYSLSSRIRLGLELGFLYGRTAGMMRLRLSREEDYFFSPDDFGTISVDEQSDQKPSYTLQSMPVSLTLSYSLPFGKWVNFFLGCGGGYYPARIRYREEYEYDFNYRDEQNLSGSIAEYIDQYSTAGTYSEACRSQAFGFHVRAGLEIQIRRNAHLVIEAWGRKVEFGNWKGRKKDTYDWSHTWGYWGAFSEEGSSEDSGEGKLWMVEFWSEETGKSYPRLIFSEEEPLSPSFLSAREMKMNLDGFSLRVGIRFSL